MKLSWRQDKDTQRNPFTFLRPIFTRACVLGLYVRIQHSTWGFLTVQNNGSQHFCTPLSTHTCLWLKHKRSANMGSFIVIYNYLCASTPSRHIVRDCCYFELVIGYRSRLPLRWQAGGFVPSQSPRKCIKNSATKHASLQKEVWPHCSCIIITPENYSLYVIYYYLQIW